MRALLWTGFVANVFFGVLCLVLLAIFHQWHSAVGFVNLAVAAQVWLLIQDERALR